MRATLSLVGLCALILLLLAAPRDASTQQPATGSGVAAKLDLQAQLEKGLEARRKSEFAFLADVVSLVEQGTLPRKLVDSTFIWAIKKPRHRFQYFQFGLRAQAKKLKIKI